ncbi:hypothetical protein [Paenibacillus mesophilus]|uniref:hypothetical protein n=1 Tax=Paenibacillus mesophilus TaxID=2582849 RepID=UPI001EE45B11|nr:hypothetical protein [Paenibacillus mesophilus]
MLQEDDLTRLGAPWVTLHGSKREERRWTPESVLRPDVIRSLAEALGTDEEGKALWWLSQSGADAIPILRKTHAQSAGKQRRGAAIALALLGDRTGVPDLIRGGRRRRRRAAGLRAAHSAAMDRLSRRFEAFTGDVMRRHAAAQTAAGSRTFDPIARICADAAHFALLD